MHRDVISTPKCVNDADSTSAFNTYQFKKAIQKVSLLPIAGRSLLSYWDFWNNLDVEEMAEELCFC